MSYVTEESTTSQFATLSMPLAKTEAAASIATRYGIPGFTQAVDDTLNGRLVALLSNYSAGILTGKDHKIARRSLIQRQMLTNRGIG